MPEIEMTVADDVRASIEILRPYIIDSRNLPDVHDQDFTSFSGWTAFSGTATQLSGLASHPGIIRLTTGASTNDQCAVGATGSATDLPIWLPSVMSHSAVVRIPTVTSVCMNIGFYGTSLSGTHFGNNTLAFELDTSVGDKLSLRADNAGTPTLLASTVTAVSNTWYLLSWLRLTTTSVEFYVNGASQGTISTNLPAGAVGEGAAVQALTASARTLDIDRSKYELYVAQRY